MAGRKGWWTMSAGTMGNMTPTKKPDAEKRNAEREAALTFVRMAKRHLLYRSGLGYACNDLSLRCCGQYARQLFVTVEERTRLATK